MQPEVDGPHAMGDVKRFYQDRTIFMTGTSGFIGKIALEKLLRTCDVRRIYVLLRVKKDKQPQKRLEEFFEGVVFEKLNKECPEFKKKVSVVLGDCREPDLGLSEQDRRLLQDEVEVIIHWAATVRFDENLKTATYINVRAVRDLLKIAKQMPKLKSFLHCSTAFSHCERSDIDEVFYDTPMNGEKLISAMEAVDNELASKVTTQFLGQWHNTYVYTKAVAEDLIRIAGKELPVGVFRPSVVLPCYNEPVPGWVENLYSTIGLVVGVAIGLVRVIRIEGGKKGDLVPADYVVNSAIVAAWDIAKKRTEAVQNFPEKTTVPPIYNYVSTAQNPLTWPQFIEYAYKYGNKIPSPLVVWHYVLFLVSNKYLYKIAVFLLHYVPAYVIDLIAICIGKKPLLVQSYKKIDKFSSLIDDFLMCNWQFKNGNVQSLWSQLSEADRKNFQFDMGSLDWDDYFSKCLIGCRIYLLKDPLDTIPAGRKKLFKLKMLHYLFCALLLLGLYKFTTWMVSLFI